MTQAQDQTGEATRRWAEYPRAKAVGIDAAYKTHLVDLQVRRAMMDALTSFIAPAASVLDVGCGTGDIAVALHDLGYRVTGLDVSSAMLEVFRENAAGRDIPVVIGDVFALPATGPFDAAVCRYVFSHYQDFERLLEAIARHVRPGGHIVFDSFSTDAVRTAAPALGLGADAVADKVYRSLAHFDHAALCRACENLGLVVEKRVPSHFFHRNPLFAAACKDMAQYDSELAEHLADPGVQRLVEWLHGKLDQVASPSIFGGVVSVLRKI